MLESLKNHCQEILEKIQNKLAGWKSKLLSQAGRTILIKSVASTIPMSTTCLHKKIIKQIDRAFMQFWWGFKANKTHNLTPKS